MAHSSSRTIKWERPHIQDRARQTADRLLEALELILQEKSFRDATVAEIAKRAKSSVGSFYGRFKDKDALLHALHERFCDESILTAEQALDPAQWEGVPVATLVEEFAGFLVAHYREKQGMRRAVAEMQWIDPRFRERSARVAAFVSSHFADLLVSRKHEITHADPRIAAEMCHRIAFSLLDLHVQYADRTPGAVALDDATLQRELVRASLSYLTMPTGKRRA